LFVGGVVGGGDEEKVVGAGEDDEFAFLTTPPGEDLGPLLVDWDC